MQKLNASALGIALGISWVACIVFVGITAMFGWGTAWVEGLSSLYIGYQASILGIIIGSCWAFLDGFIGGVMIAWIYNKINKQ